MEQLEPFLSNFSFIVIPFFLYQMFWVGKGYIGDSKNKIVMVIGEGIAIVMCMTYPMHFSNGLIYDLRYIPFILGSLYGGYYVGVPLYILIIVYRFFIGGQGVVVTFIVSTLIIILLPFLKEKYRNYGTNWKMIVTTSISVFSAFIVVSLSQLLSTYSFYSFQITSFNYILSQGIGMWLITYLVETMLENIHLNHMAVHTEKLNVVSELSASISHEVRNPLTVTKGFLQLLKHPDISYEKRRSYVQISLTELERAEMIINDYLAMTKSQKEAIIISDLKEDIHYVTNVIKPYSTIHNVNVYERFTNKLHVKYDQNQFRQGLLNIMKNCIEAMPYGGILNIDTFSVKDKITIHIKDTGIGMSKNEVDRLGTPYYTTKEKGTGLGMTVAYSAIHAMQGKINVQSEKGFGTQFTITLPGYIQ